MKAGGYILGLLLFWLVGGIGFAELARGPGPFLQRMEPRDFLRFESANELSLSRSADLVIYQSRSGRVTYALTVRKKGSLYAVSLTDVGPDPSPKRSYELSSDLGGQVVEALQLMLEYDTGFTNAPEKERAQDSRLSDCWILLRTRQSQAIAGLALGDDLHVNRTARCQTFSMLLEGLWGQANGENTEMLKELDVQSARFVATERAIRSK